MANAAVPTGKKVALAPKGASKINGPAKAESMQDLTSNATVLKSAKSNLMTGMSQNRGKGGM